MNSSTLSSASRAIIRLISSGVHAAAAARKRQGHRGEVRSQSRGAEAAGVQEQASFQGDKGALTLSRVCPPCLPTGTQDVCWGLHFLPDGRPRLPAHQRRGQGTGMCLPAAAGRGGDGWGRREDARTPLLRPPGAPCVSPLLQAAPSL